MKEHSGRLSAPQIAGASLELQPCRLNISRLSVSALACLMVSIWISVWLSKPCLWSMWRDGKDRRDGYFMFSDKKSVQFGPPCFFIRRERDQTGLLTCWEFPVTILDTGTDWSWLRNKYRSHPGEDLPPPAPAICLWAQTGLTVIPTSYN